MWRWKQEVRKKPIMRRLRINIHTCSYFQKGEMIFRLFISSSFSFKRLTCQWKRKVKIKPGRLTWKSGLRTWSRDLTCSDLLKPQSISDVTSKEFVCFFWKDVILFVLNRKKCSLFVNVDTQEPLVSTILSWKVMVLNLYNIQVQNHHFPQCIYLCDISPIDWRSFNQLHTEKWTKAFYQLCSYIFVGSYVFFFSRISFDETELPINQMSEYQNCTNFTNIKIFKISEGWNKQKTEVSRWLFHQLLSASNCLILQSTKCATTYFIRCMTLWTLCSQSWCS